MLSVDVARGERQGFSFIPLCVGIPVSPCSEHTVLSILVSFLVLQPIPEIKQSKNIITVYVEASVRDQLVLLP